MLIQKCFEVKVKNDKFVGKSHLVIDLTKSELYKNSFCEIRDEIECPLNFHPYGCRSEDLKHPPREAYAWNENEAVAMYEQLRAFLLSHADLIPDMGVGTIHAKCLTSSEVNPIWEFSDKA